MRTWPCLSHQPSRLPSDALSFPVQVNVHGFSEQDQVDLYSLTQGGASKSKQGLGQGSAPKKVAGARWEGTKMRIGESDSEPEQPEAVAEAAPEGDADAPEMGTSQQKHVILLPKSKQQAATLAPCKKGKLKHCPLAAADATSGEDPLQIHSRLPAVSGGLCSQHWQHLALCCPHDNFHVYQGMDSSLSRKCFTQILPLKCSLPMQPHRRPSSFRHIAGCLCI